MFLLLIEDVLVGFIELRIIALGGVMGSSGPIVKLIDFSATGSVIRAVKNWLGWLLTIF
jgi:hypothetical protein